MDNHLDCPLRSCKSFARRILQVDRVLLLSTCLLLLCGMGAKYVWKKIPDEPDKRALFYEGRRIGVYDGDRLTYNEVSPRGRVGAEKSCPCEPPKSLFEDRNFGVITAKIGEGPRYRCRDKASMSRADAHAMAAGLPDDSKKPFLTVIGTVNERNQVVQDVLASDFKDTIRLQSYDPTDWAIARSGFKTDGHPTIYFQDAVGKVLHRQDDYTGGIKDLRSAIRKVDPNYKPDADKDKRKPDLLPFSFAVIPWPAYALAGLGVVILLTPRKGSK